MGWNQSIKMNTELKHYRSKQSRSSRGALYTACFLSLLVPIVIIIGSTVLQAALCNYENARVRFVGNNVVEQFDTLADLDEHKFEDMFSALARANNLPLHNVKAKIAVGQVTGEQTLEIRVTGTFSRLPLLFTASSGFDQTFRIKDSQFSTYGYLAINSYPYCEFDPSHGLSTYLPLYHPSPTAPTWQFQQDNAMGSVRKVICDQKVSDDQNPENWKQLADNLTSIY
jgi:hypothetical protein